MNNQIYQQPTTEIDAKETFWHLLNQWKAIILVATAMACIVSGIKHFNDVKAYKNELYAREAAKSQASISKEERIEAIYNSFASEDVSAAKVVIKEKEWVDKQKKYLSNSIFMNTDPSNQVKAFLGFKLNTQEPEQLVSLKNSFEMYIKSDEFAGKIKPAIDQTAETQYIGELINREKTNTATANDDDDESILRVSIVLTEDSDAEAAVSLAKEAIEDYSKKVSSDYPHTLKIVGQDVSSMCNYMDIDSQKKTLDNYDEIERIMKEAESNLTEPQKQIVNAVMSIYSESDALVSENEVPERKEEELAFPGWSKKHALLGFLLGIIGYCCVYVIILIIKGCVISANMAERYSMKRVLMEINYRDKPKGLAKLFHSSNIGKLRFMKKEDESSQLKKATETITFLCKRSDLSKIALFVTDTCNNSEIEIIKKIKEEVEKAGIITDVIINSGEIDDNQLLNLTDVVLAVTTSTKVSVLHKINVICADYNVDILGCIFIARK